MTIYCMVLLTITSTCPANAWDGHFEFAWMDRIIDKMHKAGIKVIFGTPMYAIPAWLGVKHPEIFVERVDGSKSSFGSRQNFNLTNAAYLFYSERIIRKMMEHYAKHPAIIGYKVDKPNPYNHFTKNKISK
ncbi:MAG: beta-galactosidase [Ferruginibacter sp.]